MLAGVATASGVVAGVAPEDPAAAVAVWFGDGEGDSSGEPVAAVAVDEEAVATADDECVPLLPQLAASSETITSMIHTN